MWNIPPDLDGMEGPLIGEGGVWDIHSAGWPAEIAFTLTRAQEAGYATEFARALWRRIPRTILNLSVPNCSLVMNGGSPLNLSRY